MPKCFSWPKSEANFLNVKIKLSRDIITDFGLVLNFTLGDADCNHFMRLQSELVVTAKNFNRQETLSPTQIPTMLKDVYEKLNLAHKVVDVVGRWNNFWYYSSVQCGEGREFICSRPIIGNREEEFQQIVWIISLNNFYIYLIKLLISLFVFLVKVIATFCSWSFSSLFEWEWVGSMKMIVTCFSS